jgi:hypothetical protein
MDAYDMVMFAGMAQSFGEQQDEEELNERIEAALRICEGCDKEPRDCGGFEGLGGPLCSHR